MIGKKNHFFVNFLLVFAITFEWTQEKKLEILINLVKLKNLLEIGFQLNKTFLKDIKKYFQRFEDALIIVQIQIENISKIFIIDDQPLAKYS